MAIKVMNNNDTEVQLARSLYNHNEDSLNIRLCRSRIVRGIERCEEPKMCINLEGLPASSPGAKDPAGRFKLVRLFSKLGERECYDGAAIMIMGMDCSNTKVVRTGSSESVREMLRDIFTYGTVGKAC